MKGRVATWLCGGFLTCAAGSVVIVGLQVLRRDEWPVRIALWCMIGAFISGIIAMVQRPDRVDRGPTGFEVVTKKEQPKE